MPQTLDGLFGALSEEVLPFFLTDCFVETRTRFVGREASLPLCRFVGYADQLDLLDRRHWALVGSDLCTLGRRCAHASLIANSATREHPMNEGVCRIDIAR